MTRMRPMLATRGDRVPAGSGWLHEVKWDGMRVVAEVSSDTTRLWSRTEKNVTISFPELVCPDIARSMGEELLLDGEVVAVADGRPSFGALAERMHVGKADRARRLAETTPVTYVVFDLLRLDGRDLTPLPLAERRPLLQGLGLASTSWQVSPVYDDGPMLFEATRDQGLEGIVSKRLSSIYQPGARSRHWLKFPHRRRASYVIGGWRFETDSRTRLGAVLVGEPTKVGLAYRGRVGSGIAGKAGLALAEALAPLARDDSPFATAIPAADAAGTHWVEPLLVVEVEALDISGQGRLRQPAYQGMRPDLTPKDL
jgi:bifunctional non-homologous end joining protein LigD